MLTRIEIDGFKSFEDFGLELRPFTVILGGNASGKSNLFDAIQFLSHLAGADLRTATKGLRGEPADLFREALPGESADRLNLAVEVLLEPWVKDPWGAQVELSHTRIRYEVEVTHHMDPRGVGRLIVTNERAAPILVKDDGWLPSGGACAGAFRKAFIRTGRRAPWLDTEVDGERTSFRIHQDGKAGRTRPSVAAEATVLSSITTAEFPHLYALREELRSWRMLQLDPFALRRPSPLVTDDLLLPDGSNMAAVLYRQRAETSDPAHPKGVLADIVTELAGIIPGVLDVDVVRDESAREYRAKVTLRDGFEFPMSVISDGTLRVLALLTLLHDPRHRGLVCFEEPENGIHPARLKTLIDRLRDLVTDPSNESMDPEAPLTQMLLNSHSPVVLSALKQPGAACQILLADMVGVADPSTHQIRRKTRMRAVGGTDQGDLLEALEGRQVSRFEVERYLATANAEA